MENINTNATSINGSENTKANGVKHYRRKKNKYKYYNNLYLYTQILLTAIIITVSVLLKVKDDEAFYRVKEDYSRFFTADITEYSNFSYQTYLENIEKEIAEKYQIFTQVFARINAKGASSLYPSDVSNQKYTLEEKGIIPVEGIVSSQYGVRKNPFNKKGKEFHTGMDIAAEKGNFIRCAFDGIVADSCYNDISGNYIKIDSSEELSHFYGHTQFVFVKAGDKVKQGQIIATVGDTGLVTGPHLHFEVIMNGIRVNPEYAFK